MKEWLFENVNFDGLRGWIKGDLSVREMRNALKRQKRQMTTTAEA